MAASICSSYRSRCASSESMISHSCVSKCSVLSLGRNLGKSSTLADNRTKSSKTRAYSTRSQRSIASFTRMGNSQLIFLGARKSLMLSCWMPSDATKTTSRCWTSRWPELQEWSARSQARSRCTHWMLSLTTCSLIAANLWSTVAVLVCITTR